MRVFLLGNSHSIIGNVKVSCCICPAFEQLLIRQIAFAVINLNSAAVIAVFSGSAFVILMHNMNVSAMRNADMNRSVKGLC